MRQSLKRLVSMLTGLMMIIIAFIVFFQFTQPEYADIQTIRGEEAGRRAFVEKQQAAISQVKKLIDAYKDDTDFQTIVSASFPAESNLYDAVSEISGLVTLDNLTLQSFAVSEIQAQDPRVFAANQNQGSNLIKPIGTVTIKLQLFGTYEDLKKLIRHLETNIRIIDVTAVDIRPLGQANPNLYNFAVEVATYYQGK